jgi:hypothetical protein
VDNLGRLWGAGKRLSVFALTPVVVRDRAVVLAIVALACLLILAVCWLVRQPDSGEIETPILTWRRRSADRKPSVDPEPPDAPPELSSSARGPRDAGNSP